MIRETRNLDLYYQVRKQRRQQGLPLHDGSLSVAHPLVGRKLRRRGDGQIYNVEKAVRHWHWGWYIALLLERDGSHHLIRYENQSVDDPFILRTIGDDRANYEEVPS